jgi:branched-chain amino acid transport system substrate-binding protein
MTGAVRQDICVGMTASLTGRYRVPGQQAWLGAQVWAEDTNRLGGLRLGEAGARLPIRFLYYDDASDPQQCTLLTERLVVDDEVDILLGPYSSGLCSRAAAVAHRYERVLWNHGGALASLHGPVSPWVVNLLSPAHRYFYGVIDLARHLDPSAQRVAMIHSTAGAFPKEVAAGAEAYCQAQGFTAVAVYPYPPGTTDFVPLLRPLAAWHPDLVLSVGRIEDDLRFAAQYVSHDLKAVLVGLIVTPLTLFRETLGKAAERFVGPSQWEPGIVEQPEYGPTAAEVMARLLIRHSSGVDYPMAQAYAGGLVAQRCLEVAATLQPARLRQAAYTLNFSTFYGHYKVDPESGQQIGHTMPVVQWQGTHKKVLWPRPMEIC